MIAIVNVEKTIRESGPHEYEIRVNLTPIVRFVHNREKSLYECLMVAALAAHAVEKKKVKPCAHSIRK